MEIGYALSSVMTRGPDLGLLPMADAETNMMIRPTHSSARNSGFVIPRILSALVIVACVAVTTGFWVMRDRPLPGRAGETATVDGGAKPGTVGGVPLFGNWPKESPEVALVLTGQTYGFLSPCGCSRPQKGGLERRANFMDSLRQKGWTVVGLDLGDAAPPKGLAKQNLLKFRYTMLALAEMGYAAIGLGEYEFHNQLFNLLAEYTLQFANKPPFVLAANILGVQRNEKGEPIKLFPREEYFSGGPNNRAMIEAFEVIALKDKPAIGVVGVVGSEAAVKAEKLDPQFSFANNAQVLNSTLTALANHPAKPQVNVLLYSGPLAQAQAAAQAFPQFQIVVCQSPEPEPPQFPILANNGKTLIIQVGQKGQNIGVVGLYRNAAGFDFQYQLVPMGEEYLTPTDPDPEKNAAIEKNHKLLTLLEQYTAEVKKENLLAAARAKPLQHPAQIHNPAAKLTFVGSAVCAKCHAAEYAVWKGTPHSHAYETLVKRATRPGLRQFDPECISCHTTGFEYVGGFENEVKSQHLFDNGCENCHGPGSGHAQQPFNQELRASLSPWATNPQSDVKLPGLKFFQEMAAKKPLERGAVVMDPVQKQMISTVTSMCMKCHDGENDPKFDFYEAYPKIYHSEMKNAGLPPGAK